MKTACLFVMVACLSACGTQVVEFPNDAAGGSGGTGGIGGDGGTGGIGGTGGVGGVGGIGGVGGTGGTGGEIAPVIDSTVPAHDAAQVAPATVILANFSKDMDGTTISTTSFTLTQGATEIPGSVTLAANARTVSFEPDALLDFGTTYTATITSDVKDVDGLALDTDHVWVFTTDVAAERPVVEQTTPVDGAVGIHISNRPTATFSKAMDPTTITDATFILEQNLVSVPGMVSHNGLTNTATFTPTAPLDVGLLYVATISADAADSSGLEMERDHVWTFTTAACSQAPVVLGASGNFAILGGSTVTSTGLTSITGDLGVSPGTEVSGFPPGILVGLMHAGVPTSAQAIADLTTAYNDAAGRTLCPVSVTGNLGGMTLAPGLYKSTSSLEITSGDLTLDAQGDGDAIFIFQMASTLTTTDGRQVILINGAKSANVFWQVGSSATLGTTSAFHGTIMADQAITLGTGATLTGRALARIAAVNLDSNVVVLPAP